MTFGMLFPKIPSTTHTLTLEEFKIGPVNIFQIQFIQVCLVYWSKPCLSAVLVMQLEAGNIIALQLISILLAPPLAPCTFETPNTNLVLTQPLYIRLGPLSFWNINPGLIMSKVMPLIFIITSGPLGAKQTKSVVLLLGFFYATLQKHLFVMEVYFNFFLFLSTYVFYINYLTCRSTTICCFGFWKFFRYPHGRNLYWCNLKIGQRQQCSLLKSMTLVFCLSWGLVVMC